MEQLERISQMEARLARLCAWQPRFSELLSRLEQAREDANALADYLSSPDWRRDREADEAGLLPPTLRRGVLSEDGIYNALETQSELLETLRDHEEKENPMLPKDPMILFSVVNTKLRDDYATLDALCEDMDEDRGALEAKLASAGFVYDEKRNQFR